MRAPSHKLQQHVIIPIALLVVLAMAVVVGFVWYSASTQDRIALEKSIEAVRTAVTRKHAQLGATATDYGWWNDAVEHLDLSLDEGWADDNIGLYQYETYGIELSLVVDRRDLHAPRWRAGGDRRLSGSPGARGPGCGRQGRCGRRDSCGCGRAAVQGRPCLRRCERGDAVRRGANASTGRSDCSDLCQEHYSGAAGHRRRTAAADRAASPRAGHRSHDAGERRASSSRRWTRACSGARRSSASCV